MGLLCVLIILVQFHVGDVMRASERPECWLLSLMLRKVIWPPKRATSVELMLDVDFSLDSIPEHHLHRDSVAQLFFPGKCNARTWAWHMWRGIFILEALARPGTRLADSFTIKRCSEVMTRTYPGHGLVTSAVLMILLHLLEFASWLTGFP